jgi:hypothetical protein
MNAMQAWRATVVVLCLETLAVSSGAAQGVSSEAKELARLSLSSGQFDLSGTQAAKIGVLPVQRAIEDRLGRKLTEDESRRLTEVFTRAFKQTIPQSEYEENLAGQFARYYSPQELTELVAFYRTPLGMKALRFASTVSEENALFVQRLATARTAQLIERFNAEFAREFPKLGEELQRKQRERGS